MGSGSFAAGKFRLGLSIRHNADAIRLDQWRTAFERASQLLFDATDGQHQFGRISVSNNWTGGSNADAWLLEPDGSSSYGGLGELGNPTIHMTLYGDERFRPFVVVHECSHYIYSLEEEYEGPGGEAQCIGGTTADACIMEAGWQDGDRFGSGGHGGAFVSGRVSEFCVAANHNDDGTTWQSYNHPEESCWESMHHRYADLKIPQLPAGPPPVSADPIEWIVLALEHRCVLVVDRSGSMEGNRLTEAKYGVDSWAATSIDGERLGIVSFSHTVSRDFPLTTIVSDVDRTRAQMATAVLSAGGLSSIGGGMREGLEMILEAGPQAATQLLVLLTDGVHNSGEHPRSVLPDLRDNGVRVYAIGIGRDIDSALLLEIAATTGGAFYRIDPSLPPSEQDFHIRRVLQEISGIAHENGGVVTTVQGMVDGDATVEALIEAESERAIFLLSWKTSEDRLSLELVSPDEEHITLTSIPPGVRSIYSGGPYVGFEVKRPTPGTWRMNVVSEERRKVEFVLFAFSQNPSIDGGLSSPWRFYKPGEVIPVHLQTYFDEPVTNVEVTGSVRLPGGKEVPLTFSDDGSKETGDKVPGDGLYTALFDSPGMRGMYVFEALVESDGERAIQAGGCDRPYNEVFQSTRVPRFHRQFRLTVAVGEEPRTWVQVEPESARPGERLRLRLRGHLTHFLKEGLTQVSLGEGIRVGNVHVEDTQSAVVEVFIQEDAQPGFRRLLVTTPVRQETVEIEAGFAVLPDRPVARKERVGGLLFDPQGQLFGFRLGDRPDVIRVPHQLERVLKEALTSRLEVTPIVNAETGELESLEVG